MMIISLNAVNPLSSPISIIMGKAIISPSWTTDSEAMAAFKAVSPFALANLIIDCSKPLKDS